MMPLGTESEQEGLVRMPISLPFTLHEWIREASHRRRVSMAEVVREALREYRERVDPQLELPIAGRDAGQE
jgi:Arc/MetJ-type ribon-helix-helix transcriptional regulator